MPEFVATCKCPCSMTAVVSAEDSSRGAVVKAFEGYGFAVLLNGMEPPRKGHWILFDKNWLSKASSCETQPHRRQDLHRELTHVRELEAVYKDSAHDVMFRTEKFSQPEDVFEAFRFLGKYPKEMFLALLLSRQNGFLGYETISVGSEGGTNVVASCAFRAAILVGASKVVFLHNHPSGEATPSLEDHDVTHELVRAGKLLGIDVLDHLVVADQGFTSLVRRGVLNRKEVIPDEAADKGA